MKKVFALALAAVMMAGMAGMVSAHDATTTAIKSTPDAIDGIKDAAWANAESIVVDDYVTSDYSDMGAERSSAVVWSMWDGDYLYFFAEVTDKTPDGIVKDNMWDQDAIGFMVNYDYSTVNDPAGISYRDLGADSYAGYTNVSPTFDAPQANSRESSTIMDLDAYYNQLQTYVVKSDNGWNVEARLPLSLYKTFKEGDKIGYEICLNMADGGNVRVGQAVWKFADDARGNDSWTNPSNFGTLVLGAAPIIIEEVVEAPADAAQTSDAAAATTVAAAPQTFDASILMAAAAALSLAGIAVSKKR